MTRALLFVVVVVGVFIGAGCPIGEELLPGRPCEGAIRALWRRGRSTLGPPRKERDCTVRGGRALTANPQACRLDAKVRRHSASDVEP